MQPSGTSRSREQRREPREPEHLQRARPRRARRRALARWVEPRPTLQAPPWSVISPALPPVPVLPPVVALAVAAVLVLAAVVPPLPVALLLLTPLALALDVAPSM